MPNPILAFSGLIPVNKSVDNNYKRIKAIAMLLTIMIGRSVEPALTNKQA